MSTKSQHEPNRWCERCLWGKSNNKLTAQRETPTNKRTDTGMAVNKKCEVPYLVTDDTNIPAYWWRGVWAGGWDEALEYPETSVLQDIGQDDFEGEEENMEENKRSLTLLLGEEKKGNERKV